MTRQSPSNRSLAALAVLSLTAALLMVIGTVASSPANSFVPPTVPIPACFKTIINKEFCPQVNPGDNTYHDPAYGTGLGATTSGSMTNGSSFSVTLDTPVGPCENQSQSGCYVSIDQFSYSGVAYYMTYASHTSTHRVGERVTGTISSQPGYLEIKPQGSCDEDFNNVYSDGYKFAERATAAVSCTFDVYYSKSYEDKTLVPIDRLKGPTWYEISGSIWVCDQPGGRTCSGHQEYVVSLVGLNGDLAPGTTASCAKGTQSGPGGSSIIFSGSGTTTLLDVVRSWTVQPPSAISKVSHSSYYARDSRVDITATQPGQVTGTYRLESWQGISTATCTATVLDDPNLPTPPPDPTPSPSPSPTPTPTPTPSPTPAPACTGPGKPKLSVSAAKVGKPVKVKPGSWGNGATLSYTWKAGSKVVGTKAKLKPSQAMVGKKLKVTIIAARSGCATAEKVVLAAGKVRG